MFPTRTTSTTGTLRVPPLAAPGAARAAEPAAAPPPAPAPPAPAPAAGPAAHPAHTAAPTPVAGPAPMAGPAPVAAPAPMAGPDSSAAPAFTAGPDSVPMPAPAAASASEAGLASGVVSGPVSGHMPGPAPAAESVPRPAAAPTYASGLVSVIGPEPALAAAPQASALVGSPAAAEHAGVAEASFGRAASEAARPAPEPPHGWEVPAARAHPYDEGDQGADPSAAATALDIPHPQAEEVRAGVATLRLRAAEADAAPEVATETEAQTEAPAEVAAAPAPTDAAAQPHSGVPGPGPVEIVARAVARGLEEADGTPDLPHVAAHRGTSVIEVPVHLPFRSTQRLPVVPAPAATPAPAPARAPRPAPGRRVPRGDDRLREQRGPVLPGWVGVCVGGLALAGCAAVLWRAGVVPAPVVAAFGATPRAYHGLRATHWPPLAFLGIVALVALGGLGRARTGHAWVLTLFGRYRGTVRRTGLTWVSPLLLRRRIDVRLRHWRSDPMPAVDSGGLALQVVVQVVWQVKDTARATLAVEDHTEYLAEQVESAMARVLSQLPADAFHEDAPTLRDAEAVGDALTRMLAAETEAVGIEVFSAQPTRIEYAAEVAEAMRRRRVAAIDAKHRDTVLSSVVDAVDDTVHRLTSRGLVELDDYERKALVKDLTVAFYTGRSE
ncbi:SPFH domain-containing protein [Streptomyces sp. NPDC097617]|uniref:SPFH domain-containing protein n=1 Tax=Streptomyces sp. NPDC097617 TaxID=3366091 RepID=UPI00382C1457